MTRHAAPSVGVSVILLCLSWLASAVGIYPAIEARSVAHPLTLTYFLLALIAAVAPFAYSLKRLGGWWTWLLIVLSAPPLLLVLGIAYKLARGTLV